MKDSELNELLKAAKVPARDGEFWLKFPGEVLEKLARAHPAHGFLTRSAQTRPESPNSWFQRNFLRVATSFSAGCLVVLGCLIFLRRDRDESGVNQVVEAKKMYDELQEMFPNQVKSVVFGPDGASIDLAENRGVPSTPAVYLKLCGPAGCQRAITVSGQQIKLGGETVDVLVDHTGQIIVAGTSFVWSSANPGASASEYNVKAVQFGPKS